MEKQKVKIKKVKKTLEIEKITIDVEKKKKANKIDSPFVKQLKKDSYILRAMVKKNFKAQYRNSMLGVLWTVLNPLLNMIVLSLVFSRLFQRESVGIYPVYLFCGNLMFNMMRQITTQSLNCLVSNSGLIKKVKINYSVFPVSNMFTALVNFGVAFIALLIVMIIVGQTFHWTIILTVLIIPAVLLFSLGIGYILSSLYVFFRDIKHIYDVGITLWMYLTPIFYTASALNNPTVSTVIGINPMTHFVTAFRNIIQWGVVPSATEFLICYGWAIGMLLIGHMIFKLNRRKYILYI